VAIWPADTVPPVADAGLDTTICRGGKAKLGTHTYSDFIYQWSPTAGLSNDSGGVVWASPDTTTTYYLLATDDIFTKTKDSVTVFVNNCGQNDTTVCIENQFIIGTSPNPAWNYLWSPSTWLSSSTVATPICSPMVSQSYQLLITNTAGDTIALDSTHVLVASCFFADAGLNPLICKDDSIQIGTHHFPYVQYHWTPNYMLSNPSVGNPVAWPDTSTYYYLQVTDSIGNVSNDSVLVNVQICTGINELQKPNYGMEVYPNPAIDYITVSLNNEYLEETDIAITVYDAQGKLVISRKLNSGTDQLIDIKQLNSGIYTAYLIIDGIISDSKKLIVINK
jgi:hypothetical protein